MINTTYIKFNEMKNIYLFQPQYSVEVRKQENYWIPYSVGCIWSYCNQFDEVKNNFILKDIIFKREHPDKILERLDNPVLCGFSCYIWNEQYCLGIAKLVKEKFPNCIIEFGGPQASKKMQEENDFIDTVIISEGEENFLDILKSITENKEIKKYYERTRLSTLDYPSPYQSNIFSKIIEENPDVIWAATIETNRGCPHRCTFCDWGGTTMSKVDHFDIKRVEDDITWIKNNNIGYLFVADANFGMYKERDILIAEIIRDKLKETNVGDVVLQFAKNSTEAVFKIAKILEEHCLRGITISVQSMNQPTLKAIKRKNLHINDLTNHMRMSQEYGVKTYTELILPLPEETLETWKDGLSKVLECGQHESIDVWFCQLFGNSELGSEFSRKMHGIETVKAYDYISFTNPKEYHGFKEIVEIVNKTNSMATLELIESYLYAWTVIQFHINGYAQLIAKYLFYNKNITYRMFYDEIFEKVQTDNGIIGEYFQKLKFDVKNYLTEGILPDNKSGHSLEFNSPNDFSFFMNNRNEVFALIDKSLVKFGGITNEFWDLQKNFVYDSEVDYPITISSSVDTTTWEDKPTSLMVSNKRDESIRNDFWVLRRKGLLKNTVSKIDE